MTSGLVLVDLHVTSQSVLVEVNDKMTADGRLVCGSGDDHASLVSFSVLENKQVRISFFSVLFMPYNKSLIGQASSVKTAGYWPSSLLAFFMDLDFVSVHKDTKTRIRPISSHLHLALGQ